MPPPHLLSHMPWECVILEAGCSFKRRVRSLNNFAFKLYLKSINNIALCQVCLQIQMSFIVFSLPQVFALFDVALGGAVLGFGCICFSTTAADLMCMDPISCFKRYDSCLGPAPETAKT